MPPLVAKAARFRPCRCKEAKDSFVSSQTVPAEELFGLLVAQEADKKPDQRSKTTAASNSVMIELSSTLQKAECDVRNLKVENDELRRKLAAMEVGHLCALSQLTLQALGYLLFAALAHPPACL